MVKLQEKLNIRRNMEFQQARVSSTVERMVLPGGS